MDVNFDRKKVVNLWGVRQHYNRHLERLDSLMNSSQLGKSKSPMRILEVMHHNHQRSQEFKEKCTQRAIRKEHMRFTQFVREMSLPRL
jgi:demethoxyubiquinone hydroxylase (CLK1/Coq7/Cat5 family)